ncbi:hypothetical protein BDY24DRAFT_152876 [Mrakia frigida]|uniref:uncharacterized protein n=1 Tax=Mrakia frigida TaxID=29902 RepID=UPI003FCC105F
MKLPAAPRLPTTKSSDTLTNTARRPSGAIVHGLTLLFGGGRREPQTETITVSRSDEFRELPAVPNSPAFFSERSTTEERIDEVYRCIHEDIPQGLRQEGEQVTGDGGVEREGEKPLERRRLVEKELSSIRKNEGIRAQAPMLTNDDSKIERELGYSTHNSQLVQPKKT